MTLTDLLSLGGFDFEHTRDNTPFEDRCIVAVMLDDDTGFLFMGALDAVAYAPPGRDLTLHALETLALQPQLVLVSDSLAAQLHVALFAMLRGVSRK